MDDLLSASAQAVERVFTDPQIAGLRDVVRTEGRPSSYQALGTLIQSPMRHAALDKARVEHGP